MWLMFSHAHGLNQFSLPLSIYFYFSVSFFVSSCLSLWVSQSLFVFLFLSFSLSLSLSLFLSLSICLGLSLSLSPSLSFFVFIFLSLFIPCYAPLSSPLYPSSSLIFCFPHSSIHIFPIIYLSTIPQLSIYISQLSFLSIVHY